MSFTLALDPALVRVGMFEIRYYGIIYVAGFLAAFFTLERARRKGTITLSKDDLYDFLFYLMVGVVLGARILHVISGYAYYLAHPLQIIEIWKGGMALYGGIAGAFLAAYYFCKRKRQDVMMIADMLSPLGALMLGFGRLTNLINGELYGTVTDAAWCVNLPGVEGCRHPYQLYASAGFFLIFLLLLWLKNVQVKQEYAQGFLFWMLLLLISISRFVIDFWKDAPRMFGLDFAQYISVAVIIGMIALHARVLKKAAKGPLTRKEH